MSEGQMVRSSEKVSIGLIAIDNPPCPDDVHDTGKEAW